MISRSTILFRASFSLISPLVSRLAFPLNNESGPGKEARQALGRNWDTRSEADDTRATSDIFRGTVCLCTRCLAILCLVATSLPSPLLIDTNSGVVLSYEGVMRCRLQGYKTHRVRPGRLAARLRVNVLLVISGQLLRRSSASCLVFS